MRLCTKIISRAEEEDVGARAADQLQCAHRKEEDIGPTRSINYNACVEEEDVGAYAGD